MPTIITAGALAAKGYGFGSASTGPAVYVEDVFSTWLYFGNGSTQAINNGIDLATKGGMVWIKCRPNTLNYALFDTLRGMENVLSTPSQSGQENIGSGQSVSTTGFTVKQWTSGTGSDQNTISNYVSWTFRKQAKFFDVVTYTGTNTTNPVAHSLGVSPGFIIIKKISGTGNWAVAARYPSATNGYIGGLSLNTTGAALASGFWPGAGAITSATFDPSSIFDNSYNQMNDSGSTYVAYLFADSNSGGFGSAGTDSVVACGSYTGNGSASGPTVTLGWEPQFVIVKNASASGGWNMFDNMRGIPTGSADPYLFANSSAAEATTNGDLIDLTSTGFVIKSTNSQVNTSGNTYIYLAIRRGPMKTPTDATRVFEPQTQNLSNSFLYSIGGLNGTPMDMVLYKSQTTADNKLITKLIGNGRYLNTTSTAAEVTGQTNPRWSTETPTNYPGTVIISGDASSYAIYKFRRAPGFFDVISWVGTGVAQSFPHNLGAAPQLLIYKTRDGSTLNWAVGYADSGSPVSTTLNLNTTDSNLGFDFAYFGGITPTATIAPIGGNSTVSQSGSNYIGYLFASCPGVSRVGSYTGTGAAQNIDCGFSAPARFVLIKRTSATGDWYVYDTARGMSAGNDPYLLINSTAAEVTGTNYVDTFATGFALTAAAPAQLNGSGHTFIFLAIA